MRHGESRARLTAHFRYRSTQIALAVLAMGIVIAIVLIQRNPQTQTPRASSPPPSEIPALASTPSPWPTPDTSKCRRATGIASDGRRDTTTALQTFLSAVPDRGCALLARGGLYRVDGTLQLIDRHGVAIYGNGATLTTNVRGPLGTSAKGKGRSTRAMIQVLRGNDVQIWGLTIDGPDSQGTFESPYEEEAGIRVVGAVHVTIRDVHVREVYGDAVSVYGYKHANTSTPSRGVVISALQAQVIGRQGVAMTGADGVTIEDSDFDAIKRSVFDLEPLPRQAVKNVRLVRNNVGTYGNTFLAGGGYGPKDAVYVGFNRSSDPIRIKFFDGTRFTIEHNVGGGAARNPFVIASGNDLRVVSNVQAFAGPGQVCPPDCGASGLELTTTDHGSMCHALAEGNTFTGARALFRGTSPQSPCSWVDGGRNIIGGTVEAPSSLKSKVHSSTKSR